MGRNEQVRRALGVVISAWIVVMLMQQRCVAFEFKVGGSQGWTVPSDPSAAIYNHWAEKSRFQIGDSLLFVYSSDDDSVLHVTKEDYDSCNTEKPLEKFTDGHTAYKFTQSGPHYFISGVAQNCHKNEKLIVVVMADRTKHADADAPTPTPAPSPPSPAPAGEESPPPPAEAPSEDSSPHNNGNGASSLASAALLGTTALFFASSLL